MKELFAYSLMASALGIIIVFTLLILLSVFMLLIRYFSDDFKLPRKKVEKPEVKTTSQLPDWVVAAVIAYLESEDPEQMTPNANHWQPSDSEKYDRWLDPGRRVTN